MKRWLYSTDHKDIGILYIIFGILSGIIGSSYSIIIRTELSNGVNQILTNNLYNTIITNHGVIMLFFAAMTILIGGFGNYLIPLIIGGADVRISKIK